MAFLKGLLPGAVFDAFRDEVRRIEEGRQADLAKKAEKKGKVEELDPSDETSG